jgi:hypothetical protein
MAPRRFWKSGGAIILAAIICAASGERSRSGMISSLVEHLSHDQRGRQLAASVIAPHLTAHGRCREETSYRPGRVPFGLDSVNALTDSEGSPLDTPLWSCMDAFVKSVVVFWVCPETQVGNGRRPSTRHGGRLDQPLSLTKDCFPARRRNLPRPDIEEAEPLPTPSYRSPGTLR